MKDFLESLEIGEGKVKLSKEEIKSILAEHGKTVTTETEKAKNTLTDEITTLKTQIENANKEIKSYKDMDIDGIKKSATEWEDKYNKLINEQEEAKKESIRRERTDAFFNDVKFASESAKAGVIAQFNAKDFKYDEETGKFQGASEWLEELKTKDTGAFLSEVANPKFTTNPTAPTMDGSLDSIMNAMGLSEEKTK